MVFNFRFYNNSRFQGIPSTESNGSSDIAEQVTTTESQDQAPVIHHLEMIDEEIEMVDATLESRDNHATRVHDNSVFQELPSVSDDSEAREDESSSPTIEDNNDGSSSSPSNNNNDNDINSGGNRTLALYLRVQNLPPDSTTIADIEAEHAKARHIMAAILCPITLFFFISEDVSYFWGFMSLFFVCAFCEPARTHVEEIPRRLAGQEKKVEGVSEEAMKSWERFIPRQLKQRQNPVNNNNGDDDGDTSQCSTVDSEENGSHDREDLDDVELGHDACHSMCLPEDELCSICLCEYECDEVAVRLPCGHVYHEDCLAEWTQSHIRCPLCNANLNGEEDQDDENGEEGNQQETTEANNVQETLQPERTMRPMARLSTARLFIRVV